MPGPRAFTFMYEGGRTDSDANDTWRIFELATAGDAGCGRGHLRAVLRGQTVISFEETAPTAEEMAQRIASIGARVRGSCSKDARRAVVGYAYASAHNERAAYRWWVSTAIYISRDHHRRGAGRALYTTLFALLRHLGYSRRPRALPCRTRRAWGCTKRIWFRAGRRVS